MPREAVTIDMRQRDPATLIVGALDTLLFGGDRTLRIVAGLAVLSLFFVLEGNARYWALLGFVPLLTGIVRYCPAYSLLGLSTCPMKRA